MLLVVMLVHSQEFIDQLLVVLKILTEYLFNDYSLLRSPWQIPPAPRLLLDKENILFISYKILLK